LDEDGFHVGTVGGFGELDDVAEGFRDAEGDGTALLDDTSEAGRALGGLEEGEADATYPAATFAFDEGGGFSGSPSGEEEGTEAREADGSVGGEGAIEAEGGDSGGGDPDAVVGTQNSLLTEGEIREENDRQ